MQSEQHVIYRLMSGGDTVIFVFLFLNQNISFGCSKRATAKLELDDFDLILRERERERERRLRLFGHEENSSGAARTACDIQVDARLGAQYLFFLFLNQNI